MDADAVVEIIDGTTGLPIPPGGFPEGCFCLTATLVQTVDRLSITPARRGGGDASDFWGFAAHEVQHIVALYNRLRKIADDYNRDHPQEFFESYIDAKIRGDVLEVELGNFVHREETLEQDHDQGGGHGTPEIGKTQPWNGAYHTK